MLSKQLSLDVLSTASFKSDLVGQSATKVCKTCQVEKPDSAFIKADGRHRATRNRCKQCAKEQQDIRRRLRLSHPEPPPGDCPICNNHTNKWVLDHCHTEETFRGYICTSCNSGIGLLHDDPDILTNALFYLLTSTQPYEPVTAN